MIIVGYGMGIALMIFFGYWELIFISGYALGLLFTLIKTKLWRRGMRPTLGRKTDEFFHAMYVTDEGKTKEIAPAALYECDEVVGASLLGSCVFFARGKNPVSHSFAISGKGEGELDFYVGGLASGVWLVRDASGRSVKAQLVSKDSGFLSFRAPAGIYTLTH